MRRVWREEMGSPWMLGRQTHVGEQGALSGVMFLSGMWRQGSQGLQGKQVQERDTSGTGMVSVIPSKIVAAHVS